MTKSREIEPFWSWIPAFRAVAEHQSLSEAAAALDISRSALSRSIRLLEQNVGVELFRRSGRTLSLNRRGEQFLESVRLAMRVVHEGFSQVRSETPTGKIVVSSSGPCLHLIEPVLSEVTLMWPDLDVEVCFCPPAETNAKLLRGEIDLALLTNPTADDTVQLERLGELEYGVYCGLGHALQGLTQPAPEAVLEHAFVAPHTNALPGDPWPPSLPREVGLRVHQLSLAMQVCARGQLLGVFPDAAVARSAMAESLQRVPFDVLPALPAYAVRRADVADQMPAQRLLELVRAALR
ncbi:MAG: LysR family transcriptional regulator [Planctomycetota bacterium]